MIIIPGMSLPKVCKDCPFDYDNICCVVLNKGFWREDLDDYKGKLSDFPLIERPPHGRLIDADATLLEAKRISGPMTGDGWSNWGVYALIERQPTVIPAEEE